MTETPQQLRQSALKFALEAYQKVKNNRAYALTPQGKINIGSIAHAMFIQRDKEGRSHMDATPNPWQEFSGIIEKLDAAGANVLQKRPGDPKPLPKVWRDVVTNVALENPWLTKDLKAQTILQQRDPELAAHYKAMASDPYGTIAKYQDELAARATLEQVPYSQAEHDINPWRTNDLAAQSAYVKNAPPGVAEFVKAEARDVEIPLFGKNRNLTVEGQLAKDPAMFALMKVAQQIRDTWRAEDVAVARQKAESAQAEIKRLAEIAA